MTQHRTRDACAGSAGAEITRDRRVRRLVSRLGAPVDESTVGLVGPLIATGRAQRVAPYAVAAMAGVVARPFDGGANAGAWWAAACLSLVVVVASVSVSWSHLPRNAQAVPPVSYLAAAMLIIHTDGGLASPYLSLLVVPMLWLAVYESPRAFGFALAAASAFLCYEVATRPSADDIVRGSIALAVGCAVLPSIRRLVTEIHNQARELVRLADHDGLTGLPNRRAVDRRMDAHVAHSPQGLGMIYIDIDDFKQINDRHGHDVGDELLRQIAIRLSTVIREADLIGRIGGDEFVIIADGDRRVITALGDRVASVIHAEPFQLGATTATVSASIGLSHSSDGIDDLQTLLREADAAMYAIKRSSTAGRQPPSPLSTPTPVPLIPRHANPHRDYRRPALALPSGGSSMTQPGEDQRSAVAPPIAKTIEQQALEAPPGGDLSRTGEPLEALVRHLLVLVGRLTGLESTYLTAIDWEAGAQDIVYARNDGMLQIPEGLRVEWSDTLCRRALEGGPSCTSDVPGIYPDSSAARDLGIRTYVTVPVRGDSGETIGTLCGASTDVVAIHEDGLLLMETLAEMIRLHRTADASAAQLEHLALTDPLTGLANRRQLAQQLERVTSHARRHRSVVSLLIIDVDHFKATNDSLGHEAGDAVLVGLADGLRDTCRAEDIIGRWGGDEFVVLSPDIDEPGAARLAERIRNSASSPPQPVSLSIGAATAIGDRTADLFTAADAALYEAKTHGRSQARSVRIS